jgi:hypothetical protein
MALPEGEYLTALNNIDHFLPKQKAMTHDRAVRFDEREGNRVVDPVFWTKKTPFLR